MELEAHLENIDKLNNEIAKETQNILLDSIDIDDSAWEVEDHIDITADDTGDWTILHLNHRRLTRLYAYIYVTTDGYIQLYLGDEDGFDEFSEFVRDPERISEIIRSHSQPK